MLLKHSILLALAILSLPAAAAAAPSPGHYYGTGHANLAWTPTFFAENAAGSGTLTTNLATFGEAMAFQMPITSMDLQVLTIFPGLPTSGHMTVSVPAAADPWWATYPGGVPPGITTGGTIDFTLAGHAEQHANAVTMYGTYTVSGATGQYAGLVSSGDWSSSATGGGSSFGPLLDFAIIGNYS